MGRGQAGGGRPGDRLRREAAQRALDQRRLPLLRVGGARLPGQRQCARARAAGPPRRRRPAARLPPPGLLGLHGHLQGCGDAERPLGRRRGALADLGRGRGRVAVKRALVTGGHGFVASHLARALLERGDAVTVLDLAPPPLSGLTLQGVAPEVELVEADLCDARRVAATVDAGEFDVVFHLAAQTLVGPAMADPAATFEANVRGTWILLEACRRVDTAAVVVASSDKAYGPSEQLPYREDMQ